MTETTPAIPQLPAHVRARGQLRAAFAAAGGVTSLMRLHEAGGLRLRCPRVSGGCEAVSINTGGGMAGGDTARCAYEVGAAARVTFTSQAAEKVYRSDGDAADVRVSLRLAAGARAEWLPQETILFDGARLDRRIDIDMAGDATLMLMESTVFGRLAMGEQLRLGRFTDNWRVRRDGQLVLAEALRLEGPVADLLDRPALGQGARAVAGFLIIAPDAGARLGEVRALLADATFPHGVSAWNTMLLARLAAPSPEALRAAIVRLLSGLRGRSAPRVWQ